MTMQQKKDTTPQRPSSAERENSTTRARANENTTSHDPSPRADYERLAEALLLMTDLETERVGSRLDADLSGGTIHQAESDNHLLANALNRHLFLTFESIDWYSREAMRLYVEMRLLADEQSARRL